MIWIDHIYPITSILSEMTEHMLNAHFSSFDKTTESTETTSRVTRTGAVWRTRIQLRCDHCCVAWCASLILAVYVSVVENWTKTQIVRNIHEIFFARGSKTHLLPWTLFVCWLEWIHCMYSLTCIAWPVRIWKNRWIVELSFPVDQNEKMWVVFCELLFKTIALCATEYPKRRSYGIRITPIK